MADHKVKMIQNCPAAVVKKEMTHCLVYLDVGLYDM